MSGTAQPLTASTLSPTIWVVRAALANTGPVYVGDRNVTASTGFELDPGSELTFAMQDIPGATFNTHPQDLYVVGSGGVVSWVAFL